LYGIAGNLLTPLVVSAPGFSNADATSPESSSYLLYTRVTSILLAQHNVGVVEPLARRSGEA